VLDKFIGYIESGQYFIASIVVVFAVLVNIEKIFSIIDTQKKKRIGLLKEAIANDALSISLKEHFKNEIQGEYFYQAHKISMDKFKRDLVLDAHIKLDGDITFKQFKLANNHIAVVDGKLNIEISKLDSFSYYYNMFFGVLMAIAGFFLLFIPVAITDPTVYQVFYWLIICVFLIGFGFFMILQTLPLRAAKRIRTVINALEKSF